MPLQSTGPAQCCQGPRYSTWEEKGDVGLSTYFTETSEGEANSCFQECQDTNGTKFGDRSLNGLSTRGAEFLYTLFSSWLYAGIIS